MIYRRPLENDYSQMLALQNRNLVWELTPEEAKQGCLLRAFSLDDFRAMDAELCVMLAFNADQQLAGYLCATRLIENSRFEVIQRIYQHCKKVSYHGKSLLQYKAFIASPMCIERAYRGTSLFFDLCSEMLKSPQITSDYELILTFVSVDNMQSLRACRRLSFQPIEIFNIKDLRYWLLVQEINLQVERKLVIQRG